MVGLSLDADEIAHIDQFDEIGIGLLADAISLKRTLHAPIDILQVKEGQFAKISAADDATTDTNSGHRRLEPRCLLRCVGPFPALRIRLDPLISQLLDFLDLDLADPLLRHDSPCLQLRYSLYRPCPGMISGRMQPKAAWYGLARTAPSPPRWEEIRSAVARILARPVAGVKETESGSLTSRPVALTLLPS